MALVFPVVLSRGGKPVVPVDVLPPVQNHLPDHDGEQKQPEDNQGTFPKGHIVWEHVR